MKDKGITIIITAYRAEQFIEETLNSIYAQSYFKDNEEFEILIGVDGCRSTYNKMYALRGSYRNMRVFVFNNNLGTYIVRNSLTSQAKYNNLLFFDSDDVMYPNMIQTVMETNSQYITYYYHKWQHDITSNVGKPNPGSFFINKNLFDYYGGFMPWRCAADAEIHQRMKRCGCNSVVIQEPMYKYRVHTESLSHKRDTGAASEIRKSYWKLRDNFEEFKVAKIIKTTNSDYFEIFKNSDKKDIQAFFPGKKLGIIYNLFDEIELFKIAVEYARPAVDYICVTYQNVSYNGIKAKRNIYFDLKKMKQEGLIDYIIPYIPNTAIKPKMNEIRKRNIGINYCHKNKCTHYMALDSDEIFKTEELKRAKNEIFYNGADFSVCKMITYYKTPTTILFPPEEYYIPLIIEMDDRRFTYKFQNGYSLDSGRSMPFSRCHEFEREDIQMHHFSFCMKDMELKLKTQPTPIREETLEKILDHYNKFEPGMKALTNNGYFQTKQVEDSYFQKKEVENELVK